MPLDRTPLDPASLSEPARKALSGPGPMKLMAARGLAPIPKPAELLSVVYQLSLDDDQAVKSSAERTAGELPDKILLPAVSDAAIDARVLDFVALRVLGKPPILEALILNQNTAGETVRDLATRVGEMHIELIAGNEERLLREPRIIGAMYMNPKARMSTVDRAIELAVRNNVQVPGIPGWEAVVSAVLGTKKSEAEAVAEDETFAKVTEYAVVENDETRKIAEQLMSDGTTEEQIDKVRGKDAIDRLSIPGKLRLATLGNSFARSILIRNANRMVALAAIRSPKVSDEEVIRYAANRTLADDVIREIANAKEWTRIYQVKVYLCNNPKCPLPVSMRLLPLLHERDVKSLSNSRSVPSALVAMAKKLVQAKQQGRHGQK
jgi:hypothetical protein